MKQKLAVLFLAFSLAAAAAPPVPVIFDTDMGNDIDDALALAMLHALQSRGEINLVAVTVTKDNPWAGRYVSAVNTFYGRAGIPIGVVKNGVTREEGNYNRKAIEGRYKYAEQFPGAVEVLEKALTRAAGPQRGADPSRVFPRIWPNCWRRPAARSWRRAR